MRVSKNKRISRMLRKAEKGALKISLGTYIPFAKEASYNTTYNRKNDNVFCSRLEEDGTVRKWMTEFSISYKFER